MPTVGITVNFQGMAEGFSIEGFGMFYLTPSKNAGMIVYTEGQKIGRASCRERV